jgi:hypothetical protein
MLDRKELMESFVNARKKGNACLYKAEESTAVDAATGAAPRVFVTR